MSAAFIWNDGEVVASSGIQVNAWELGYGTGLGAFETTVAINGEVRYWDKHLRRLTSGLERLGIPFDHDLDWHEAFAEVLAANGLTTGLARVRVTVSALAGTPDEPFRPQGARVVIATTQTKRPTGPAIVVTHPFCRNSTSPLAGIKCVSYADSLLVYNTVRAIGADEALLGNEKGMICEGATSNVFIRIEGRWHTPPLSSGCLGGVERELVLEQAMRREIAVTEADVPLERIDEIDAAFLTSSLREMQPIASIDGRKLSGELPW